MKKSLLLIIAVTLSTLSFSQIDVNPTGASESSMTPQQLVENVLLTNCATVNWLGEQTHTAGTSTNFGFFNDNGTAFPLSSGIVLSTGFIGALEGQNTSVNTPNATLLQPGDTDLELLCNSNFPGVDVATFDAAFFEFEIVPEVNTLSFQYLFASAEYNRFDNTLIDDGKECFTNTNQGLQDSFAILVAGPGIVPDPEFAGNPPATQWRNIAKVPSTTLPVSVGTIHDNTTCTSNPSSNSALYNVIPVGTGDISLNGMTDVLTASTGVNTGDTYRIKIVIGDRGDLQGDSAVFLLGSTIGLNVDLGNDVTICGNSHIFDAGPGGDSYAWTGPNGFTANTQVINVNETGNYEVTVTVGTCQQTDDVNLTLIDTPGASRVDQILIACDDSFGAIDDNIGLFDLTFFDPLILAHPLNVGVPAADLEVVYYESEADALANVNPISDPANYPNLLGNPQVIYFRVRNINSTNCLSVYDPNDHNFPIRVEATYEISSISDISICDPDNDGTVTIDLTNQISEAIGGLNPADVVIDFYNSESDLQTNTNPFPGTSATVSTSPQTIWVRLSNTARFACFTHTSFEVTVLNSPQIQALQDFILCDDNASGTNTDGISEFDLTTYNTLVTNGQSSVFPPTYYTSMNGANLGDGTDQILNPNTFNNTTPNAETVYVRLEDSVNGCFNIAPINLIVTPVPVLTNHTLVQCEIDASIDGLTLFNLNEANASVITSGVESDYIFTYHTSQLDADNFTNPLSNPYNNTVANEIIFIRVQNVATGCYNVAQVTLSAVSNAVPSVELNLCDTDGNGSEQFVLSTANAQIQPSIPVGATIAYYASETDAQQELTQLPNTYTSISSAQVIFYRVENANDCFGIGTLQLNANPLPVLNTISSLVECSDDGVQATFTLTGMDTQIINGQSNMSVSYHLNQTDADNGINSLASPFQNTVNPQSIIARLENTNTGCFVTQSFNLEVNQNPTIPANVTTFSLCDMNNPGDEIEVFDLTEMNNVYTGGDTNLSVTYYPTLLDAQNETNQIATPHANMANPDQVFVRVEDETTHCFSTATLNLQVNNLPVAVTPTPLEACDDGADNDGFYENFNLDSKTSEIINGNASLTVTYHETQQNAIDDVLTLTSPHTNFDPYNDDVFARVVDTNGCFIVVTLQLVVYDSPVNNLPANNELTLCDDDMDSTNTVQFDLTVKYQEILGNQDLSNFPIHFYTSQNDADTDVNRINTPEAYAGSHNEVIYFRIISNANGCGTVGSFTLMIDPLPVINDSAVLEICDYYVPNNDGIAEFNLTDSINDINMGNSSLEVDFYETANNALSETQDIPDYTAYVGQDAQTIFVRVTDPTTACVTMGTLTLRVMNIPSPNTVPDYNLCDPNDGSTETVTFDLLSHGNLHLGLQATETAVYYDGNGDQIMDPSNHTNNSNPETITVVVTNQNFPNGGTVPCEASVQFQIIVPLPDLSVSGDLFICQNLDGTYQNASINAITGVDLSSGDYVISWTLDGNAIPENTLSIIATEPGTYVVNIQNTVTGCFAEATHTIAPSSIAYDFELVALSNAFSDSHGFEVNITNGIGTYEFSLDGVNYQSSNTFTDLTAGEYCVFVRDLNNCQPVPESKCISFIDYPRFFTPNGDGINDTWQLIAITDQPSAEIYIFDRYGKLIKQLSPAGNGWDGTFNGTELPSEDYWFRLHYTENNVEKVFTAHFTLKR